MFENQTYEFILNRMLSNISDDIDKREGSVAFDMLAPKAIELTQAYSELDNVLKFGFADTTYGELLDLKVIEAGLVRLTATYSRGFVTITNEFDEDFTVPVNTAVYTDNNIRFRTDNEIIVLSNSSADVNITSEVPGLNQNVAANRITNIEYIEVTCTNTVATTGGTDIESDASLLERYKAKTKSPGVSGSKNHYLQWALSIEGIGNAKIIPLWNGKGTVKVILIDSNKEPVNPVKLQEVSDYIESQRPIGATVTVVSAANFAINISANIIVEQGYVLDDLIISISNELTKYFKLATFIDPDVKYAKIGTIILGTEGVVDYNTLVVNGDVLNIPLGEADIPVLGSVTFL